ncbi:MAG: hypothetical protein KA419_19460 [Acidobacteria bacterium]|nr:hypothetical protein [Acidobacteriota bacterium]
MGFPRGKAIPRREHVRNCPDEEHQVRALENATVSLTAADGSPAPDWIILGNVSAPAGGSSSHKTSGSVSESVSLSQSVSASTTSASVGSSTRTSTTTNTPLPAAGRAPSPTDSPERYRRWLLALNQSGTLPLLAVNETKDITLTFAPAETVPPGPEPYNLVLHVASADGAVTLDVPVVVYVDASGKGNLLVQAYDLFSGSGVSRPAGSRGPMITLAGSSRASPSLPLSLPFSLICVWAARNTVDCFHVFAYFPPMSTEQRKTDFTEHAYSL